MSEQTHSALKQLQDIDRGVVDLERRMAELDESVLAVEEPAERLAQEVETTRGRLQEMRLEERRVELSTNDKQARVERLEERLEGVRNVREESAVRSEIDMVRQALAGDEQEALSLLDQIRRLELRLEEQQSELEQARAEIKPRRKDIEDARAEAEAERTALLKRRGEFAAGVPERELRLYDSIRKGGRSAVASLTVDGACGSCFGVLPLQSQNEVRHGTMLVRCETCGVILTAPESEAEADAAEAADEASAAADTAAPDDTDDASAADADE